MSQKSNAPVDLEELLLRCRSKNAQGYLREAVDCYRIGAYRACVITTWVAVAYDLIDKLRELSISGDTVAASKVAAYEGYQEARNTKDALAFEGALLSLVHKEFDLITPQELSDLSRLFEDRNRCGHPNYNRESEAYVPSPELAKLHLRNAVEHVLERPPVQGKAALDLLKQTVEDEFFPTKANDAERVLRGTPLLNPKSRLLREFLRGCLLSLMREDLETKPVLQRLSAAKAAYRLHPDMAEQALQDNFDQDVFRTDGAKSLDVIWLLRRWPDLQVYVKEPSWAKLIEYLKNVPSDELLSIAMSLHIEELRQEAEKWVAVADEELLAKLIRAKPTINDAVVKRRALELYADSTSWENAKFIAREIIKPLAEVFSVQEVKHVVLAGHNDKVRQSYNFDATVRAVRDGSGISSAELSATIVEAGLEKSLKDFVISGVDGIEEEE
jgi:hypothetical protein